MCMQARATLATTTTSSQVAASSARFLASTYCFTGHGSNPASDREDGGLESVLGLPEKRRGAPTQPAGAEPTDTTPQRFDELSDAEDDSPMGSEVDEDRDEHTGGLAARSQILRHPRKHLGELQAADESELVDQKDHEAEADAREDENHSSLAQGNVAGHDGDDYDDDEFQDDFEYYEPRANAHLPSNAKSAGGSVNNSNIAAGADGGSDGEDLRSEEGNFVSDGILDELG
jgi:hypothetical protein